MSPSTGMFTSSDPYSGDISSPMSLHKYAYANFSPTNFTDPTGMFSLGECLTALGIEGSLSGITQFALRSVLKNVVINFAKGAVVGATAGAARTLFDPSEYNTESLGKNMLNGALSGGIGYSLWAFKVLQPLLISVGYVSGCNMVEQDIKDGKYGLAVFDAGMAVACLWGGTKALMNSKATPAITSSSQGTGKPPHGNSKTSTKPQHGYEIIEKATGDVGKTGISGRPLNKNGTSPRANSQVNKLNKQAGYDKYDADVVNPSIPDRSSALDWERINAQKLWDEGNSMILHKRPRPWED